MTTTNYKISEDIFKEIYNKSKELYGTSCVLKEFCNIHCDVKEISEITPVINYIFKTSDKLYSRLVNLEYN